MSSKACQINRLARAYLRASCKKEKDKKGKKSESPSQVKRKPNIRELFEQTDRYSPTILPKWLQLEYKPVWQVYILSSGKFLLTRLILYPGKSP